MTTPQEIRFAGAVTLGPPSACCLRPSSIFTQPVDVCQVAQAGITQERRINSPSPAFVDLLANTGITNLRYINMLARQGVFTVRITWTGGVDQLLPLSEYLALSNPQTGSQITALAIQGVGDLSLVLAGD